jgi:hypothetical protein
MKHLTAIVAVLALVTAGCSRPAPVETEIAADMDAWQPVDPLDMTDTQEAQHELVLAATNALASEMMGELTAALDAGDPAAAIDVCRVKAPAVAAHVSEQFGLEIGRTSHKLRNPANVAPDWAEPYVAEAAKEPIFLAGPDGELGALLPIRLKAECQMCHGSRELIDEEVMAAIAESYPQDEAVGFAEGDLRGWFWVETPPGEAEVL